MKDKMIISFLESLNDNIELTDYEKLMIESTVAYLRDLSRGLKQASRKLTMLQNSHPGIYGTIVNNYRAKYGFNSTNQSENKEESNNG
jgi:hypothetical protein